MKSYSDKVAVENGVKLNKRGEVEALTQDEWQKIKDRI